MPASFPETFLALANEKHYSNGEELLKMIENIIIPHFNEQRKNISLYSQYPG